MWSKEEIIAGLCVVVANCGLAIGDNPVQQPIDQDDATILASPVANISDCEGLKQANWNQLAAWQQDLAIECLEKTAM